VTQSAAHSANALIDRRYDMKVLPFDILATHEPLFLARTRRLRQFTRAGSSP
jgi:hypothetical protein